MVTDQVEMTNFVERYFKEIFHTSCPQTIDQVVRNVEPQITLNMKKSLLHPVTSAEIRDAFFQMHATKSPGPDGMNAFFYQKFWHIIGNDVSAVIFEFFQSGNLLKSINYTHITLIPKVKAPADSPHPKHN
jgi:hypothetical protein